MQSEGARFINSINTSPAFLTRITNYHMNTLIIKIEPHSEGGFSYDIYDNETDNDSLDGGICTGTIFNALEMAKDQADRLLRSANYK